MTVSFRFLCMAGGIALLAGCGNPSETDNLAALDAKLTNGANAASDQANVDPAVLAAVGGRLERAPEPIVTELPAPGTQTLGEMARGQASGKAAAGGPCAQAISYGPQWAERLPKAFPLYPGARLLEAAGIDKAPCTLRIVSFSTQASLDQVIDFYYTLARRAGYDAEHLLSQGEHQLGGTRGSGNAAYVVFARRGKGDQTDVDLVANAE